MSRCRGVDEASKNCGVAMNPDKAETVTFGELDRVIVLAEG